MAESRSRNCRIAQAALVCVPRPPMGVRGRSHRRAGAGFCRRTVCAANRFSNRDIGAVAWCSRAHLADHLDRSQLLLLELLNADTSEGGVFDRNRAAELVSDNRLFRQAAQRDGDLATVAILEELERVLQEVENSPDEWTSDDLAVIRDAIENKGLILKVRVLGSQARDKALRPQTDTVITTI